LNTDNYIYSYIPRFREILSTLQSDGQLERNRSDATFLAAKINEIVKQIETFRKKTRSLRQAYKDLSEFLEKDPRVRDHVSQ